MLDKAVQSFLKPVFAAMAIVAVKYGLTANTISIVSVFIGFIAAFLIANNYFMAKHFEQSDYLNIKYPIT